MPILPAALTVLLLGIPAPPGGQDPAPGATAVAAASPSARAAWARLLEASRTTGVAADLPPAPITSFHVKMGIRTREGVQTNETEDVEYRYLAPDCVRFRLPSQREVGRSGLAQRDYWLLDGDELVELVGREYEEDRRQIQEMHAVARNFVALSDPGRLRITRLEALARPPTDVAPQLERKDRKLQWLRVASPDFALLRRDAAAPGDAHTSYAVDLGLEPDGLPRLAIIRAERMPGVGAPTAAPMLIRLEEFAERGPFRIPLWLHVHALDERLHPPAFAEKAAQEIYITEADLRPALSIEDFRPPAR